MKNKSLKTVHEGFLRTIAEEPLIFNETRDKVLRVNIDARSHSNANPRPRNGRQTKRR